MVILNSVSCDQVNQYCLPYEMHFFFLFFQEGLGWFKAPRVRINRINCCKQEFVVIDFRASPMKWVGFQRKLQESDKIRTLCNSN